MKFILIFLMLLLFAPTIHAQTEQRVFKDLYGIRLKQYREVPNTELGKPIRSGVFEDGVSYEAFELKPNFTAYMVFSYSKEFPDVIWSIQITGSDPSVDLGFSDLRFGMSKSDVEKRFGKPARKVDVGEYGIRWEYEKSNFTFEIDPKGKLSSIKIMDKSGELTGSPKFEKAPSFKQVVTALAADNNSDLLKLLAPDMEIYLPNKTLFFGRPLVNELKADESEIFRTVRSLSKDLQSIKEGSDEYEEFGRFRVGGDTMHVIKFRPGNKIKEIVFKFEWGEFLIWEIKAD